MNETYEILKERLKSNYENLILVSIFIIALISIGIFSLYHDKKILQDCGYNNKQISYIKESGFSQDIINECWEENDKRKEDMHAKSVQEVREKVKQYK